MVGSSEENSSLLHHFYRLPSRKDGLQLPITFSNLLSNSRTLANDHSVSEWEPLSNSFQTLLSTAIHSWVVDNRSCLEVARKMVGYDEREKGISVSFLDAPRILLLRMIVEAIWIVLGSCNGLQWKSHYPVLPKKVWYQFTDRAVRKGLVDLGEKFEPETSNRSARHNRRLLRLRHLQHR